MLFELISYDQNVKRKARIGVSEAYVPEKQIIILRYRIETLFNEVLYSFIDDMKYIKLRMFISQCYSFVSTYILPY